MIVKIRKNESYELIPRATLQDDRLEMDELGLLCRLISYPDGWEIRPYQLRKVTGWGRDRLRRVLRKLQEAGYLRRLKIRTPNGSWTWVSELYAESQGIDFTAQKNDVEPSPDNQAMADNPSLGNPSLGNPSSDKPAYIDNTHQDNTDLDNTDLDNTDLDNTDLDNTDHHQGGGNENVDQVDYLRLLIIYPHLFGAKHPANLSAKKKIEWKKNEGMSYLDYTQLEGARKIERRDKVKAQLMAENAEREAKEEIVKEAESTRRNLIWRDFLSLDETAQASIREAVIAQIPAHKLPYIKSEIALKPEIINYLDQSK
ncbi:hypothetical protein [Desulfuromonas acetoxidans]|uniref:hypothetical protein n=1 Tax=Desulfuromonas acetoxidans TaxID=891 RepID=UPI00292DF733|nr:hypothetical protein [Desulfuromonas acetoxidans]